MDLSDLRLLGLQVEALFTHDPAGRIVAINEPGGGGPAPRFFLGRSRQGNVWRLRHDVPEATARRLEALAAAEPTPDDLQTEPRHLAALLEALRADGAVQTIYSGPAFRFPAPLPAPPAGVTRITRANLDLLRPLQEMGWDLEALRAGEFEGWEPMLALVADDAAVALCSSVRLTARVAEAGVQTLAAYQGRGYAPRVVTAWAHAIQATGRIPLYSTAWENHASRAAAGKLGLILYGTDLSVW